MKNLKNLCGLAMLMFALPAMSQNTVLPAGTFGDGVISVASLKSDGVRKSDGTIVIVNEDFSKLTKGSESQPDTESLLDEKGYVKDNALFNAYDESCTKTWGGFNMFQAGGVLAVTDGGFVNTPTGDYSGPLRMTCRIKLTPGQKLENTDLDIILLRRSALVDFKRVTIKLTDEWQNVTFEADNGWFSDTMIQFFTMENFSYLIDDVYIEHTIVSIEVPKAIEPVTQGDNAFIAKWEGTSTADEYLLSVFSKKSNPENDNLLEGFDEINSIMDGIYINEMNANIPEGWTINVGAGEKQELYCEKDYFKSGKQSICFDHPEDFIETRRMKYPIKQCRFWVKADDREMGLGEKSKSVLSVQAFINDSWTEWVYLSVEGIRGLPDNVYDITKHINGWGDIYALRFCFPQKDVNDKCYLAIDDIEIVAPGTPLNEYLFEDKVIPGRDSLSCYVEVPDRDETYFYHVKARNQQFTSEASREVEVYDVHDPIALPATDVTGNAYTANWQCGSKVDYFHIKQSINFTADKDYPEYVLLDEDFSKVVSSGTAENPEKGELTTDYLPIDQYTKLPGWSASSLALGNGMLGGMAEEYGFLAGALRLPTMNLSNNGGTCTVAIRAYGQKGDFVVIVGGGPATQAAIQFEETGWKEMELTLRFCTVEESLTIYSGSYLPFMLDYVKVKQPIKKGENVRIHTGFVEVKDAQARSHRMENVQFIPGYELRYQMLAFRLRDGNSRDVWQSWPSEEIIVNSASSNCLIDETVGVRVWSESGNIRVLLDKASTVDIYNLSGQLVKTVYCQAGENSIELPQALYLVAVNGTRFKVSTF